MVSLTRQQFLVVAEKRGILLLYNKIIMKRVGAGMPLFEKKTHFREEIY